MCRCFNLYTANVHLKCSDSLGKHYCIASRPWSLSHFKKHLFALYAPICISYVYICISRPIILHNVCIYLSTMIFSLHCFWWYMLVFITNCPDLAPLSGTNKQEVLEMSLFIFNAACKILNIMHYITQFVFNSKKICQVWQFIWGLCAHVDCIKIKFTFYKLY